MTIYRKMVLGFGIIILVLVLVNGLILIQLREFSDTVRTMLLTDVRCIDVTRQVRTLLSEEERNARKFLVTADTLYRMLFADAATLSTPLIDSVLPSVSSPGERRMLEELSATHTWLVSSVTGLQAVRSAEGRAGGATYLLSEEVLVDSIAQIQASLDALVVRTRASVNRSMTMLEADTASALQGAVLLTIGTLLGTLIVAFLITRTITRPIKALQAGTRNVLEGVHVPIRVSSKDEISGLAEDFNDMSSRLKRSNELRTEMMQQISHEIRNPLQSMYAAYYLLSQQVPGPLTEGQRTVVENIRNNIDRISDFSTQFLDLAKIETGVMTFTLETAHLAKVIAPAVQNARVVAQERGITLIVEESDAPPVRVDVGKIEQVATNYLTNALKYTPRGGTVTVRVESCDIGARLSVTDTGLGIPPEDLPKLFTKFFQAKNSGTAGKKGTGLGLALVRAIVEQHGGTVHAESELGSGSTFSADFPAAGASREETVS